MAERKSLLPPSPRGNASKGGLRSVLFSVRGAFLARRNRRRRGKCSAPVRGAFFHRLRSGSPHGSAPFPCGTLGVGGELQKAAPSAPPPCGTTFSFPRNTGTRPRGNVASLSGAFSTPVPHSFSHASAFSRRARIPVLFLDNPRARRL